MIKSQFLIKMENNDNNNKNKLGQNPVVNKQPLLILSNAWSVKKLIIIRIKYEYTINKYSY